MRLELSGPLEADTGVIVPTADQESSRCQECLAALRQSSCDVRVCVVESSGPEFRFSKSINAGLAALEERAHYVLLNDDCFVQKGSIDQLVKRAAGSSKIGIVGAKLLYPDGTIQHAGGFILRRGPWLTIRHGIGTGRPLHAFQDLFREENYGCFHFYRDPDREDVAFVTAAFCLLSGPLVRAIGGFDEGYVSSFEDVDYCLRAQEAGFRVVYEPQATATHLEGASLKHQPWSRKASFEGEMYFRAKWKEKIPRYVRAEDVRDVGWRLR